MKSKLQIPFIVVLLVLFLAGFAYGEEQKWKIDKNHSSIYFDVRHTYVTVRGLFKGFRGNIQFDPENKDAGRVEFEVDTTSIDTNIVKRDNHLRSGDFFNASKYPLMTFNSTNVKHVSDNQYIVEGELTVKDVIQTVQVPFTYFGIRENPLKKGEQVAGFEGEFTINRLDYNVGNGEFAEMGVVGEDVSIVVALEVLRDK
ncbi:MAG: YceI family protein [Desulfobacterales bacterium]